MKTGNDVKLTEKDKKYAIITLTAFVDIIIGVIVLLYNHFLGFAPYTIVNGLRFINMISVLTLIFGGIFCICFENIDMLKKIAIVCASIIILFIGTKFVMSSKIVNHEKYRALAGTVETSEFTEDISVVDISKLPIIHADLANNLADKKLGEITSLGSQMTVGTLTMQKVGDTLYYVAPLEFTGFFKWKNNDGISPGYIMVNAQRENDIKLVTEINGQPLKLKYLNNSFFGDYIERKAFSYVKDKHLSDFSFEIDDEGNPYWTITIYEKTLFNKGGKVEGTLLIDAQTGEGQIFSVEDTPEWIDIIQDLNIVDKNLNNWGKLVHGVFNFSNKDKLKTTDGYKLIYNEDKCYYYTGITSVGSDESLVGFMLTDTRTGVSTMYKTSGAIENAGMLSAEGKVSNYGFTSAWPILINLQNEPTYFMTMLDKKGLIKGYSFVNVENYNIVSYGETLQQSYTEYVKLLGRTSISLDNNSEIIVLEGVVERIGMKMNEDSLDYNVMLEGQSEIFIVPDTSIEVTITKVGDSVKISYIDNTTNTPTVSSFDNLDIE